MLDLIKAPPGFEEKPPASGAAPTSAENIVNDDPHSVLPDHSAPGGSTPPPPEPAPVQEKRGRGRPPGSKTKKPGDSGKTPNFSDLPPPTPPPPEKPPVDYKQLSEMLGNTGVNILTMIFGPEWQWQSEEEKGAVTSAIEAYARSKQMPDIPPGVMLLAICAMYAAPRMQHPNTMTKLQKVYFWIKSKMSSKKRGPIVNVDARAS